jgi:hypothetical protein
VIKKKIKIRQRRNSKLKKRKNVSKKLKKNKTIRKKNVSKKAKRQIKKIKKRNVRKNKRVNKKHVVFVSFFGGLNTWMNSGMKKIRKEQRHCLRFKKNKGKQTFCFVKALLLEYPWRTMLGFLMVIIVGLVVLAVNFQGQSMQNYFGVGLQTSLISSLKSKINSARGQISSTQECTLDTYWTEKEENICNYWLYKQTNQRCAKFNVLTERVAIGTKMCCNSLDSIVYDGENKNVVACPGSDIFFTREGMHEATVVADKSGCRAGVCQFYPADGFLVKFDVKGNITYGGQGQAIVVKQCTVKRKVGACDRDCGGGKRTVTGQDMFCNKFSMTELCNVEPCFTETIVN